MDQNSPFVCWISQTTLQLTFFSTILHDWASTPTLQAYCQHPYETEFEELQVLGCIDFDIWPHQSDQCSLGNGKKTKLIEFKCYKLMIGEHPNSINWHAYAKIS
jgi:hypothetical protein